MWWLLTWLNFILEYGVSNGLANYILLVMNHQFGAYYNFMADGFMGDYLFVQVSTLDNELQAKMKELKFTQLSELFRALAVE